MVTSMLCFCNLFDATIIKLALLQIRVFFIYCHRCPIAWPDRAAPEAVRTGFCRKEEDAIILRDWEQRGGTPVILSTQKQL